MLSQKNSKAGRIIIINAALVLSVIAFLIVQNIYFLNKTSSTLLAIDQHHNRKVDLIMSMTNVVRERSMLMVTMYFSNDPWERDEIFIQFHKLKLVFINLKNELNALGLADDERVLLDKALGIINTTEVLQNDIIDRLQSNQNENIHSDIAEKDLPLENTLLGIFKSLIETTRNNADIAKENAQQQYHKTLKLVMVISLLVFVIAIFLIRRSLYQIKNIESILIDEAKTLSWDAAHDELTNAYNRRWIKYKLELLKNDQKNSAIKHTLLYVDLDEFKPVNDLFGHQVGDRFLCGITREFEHCIRQHDTLARIGGDEFAVLLENCVAENATEIAECMIKRVNRFSLTEKNETVTIAGCSIGLCEFSASDISYENLIKRVDAACYAAKNSGKNQIHVCSPGQ